LQNKIATAMANNFSATLTGMKFSLAGANTMHSILGTSIMDSVTSGARQLLGVPKWTASLPKSTSINKHFTNKTSDKKVVYFPSCINRTMGQSAQSKEDKTIYEVTIELLQKAGFEIILPNDLDNLCCGMPFSSKGFNTQAQTKSKQLENALKLASENGNIHILCDTSPCTKKMQESFHSDMKIYEPIEFTLDILSQYLDFKPTNEPIAIHSTCSSRKMGLHEKFIALAKMCSTDVTVPSDVSCCGFAGDRGFNFTELNKSALENLKPALKKDIKLAFSTSKTCEIGLSEHSGVDYNSIFYLVNQCSHTKQ
jgi:D-lactate dehydrogenase